MKIKKITSHGNLTLYFNYLVKALEIAERGEFCVALLYLFAQSHVHN